MKTSDLDKLEFKIILGTRYVKDNGKWSPIGRVLDWCLFMGNYRDYGEWSVQETCVSAACRGTVKARLTGAYGAVEAWNNFEVFYIPKGVRPSKAPYPQCMGEDLQNGIKYWPNTKYMLKNFEACLYFACARAGIHKQERLDI